MFMTCMTCLVVFAVITRFIIVANFTHILCISHISALQVHCMYLLYGCIHGIGSRYKTVKYRIKTTTGN